MWTTATYGSVQSTSLILFQPSVVITVFFGFIITCHVKRRSRHVSSTPSCHLIPWRSLYVSVRPSLLTSPFSTVGISLTASGMGCALSSYRTVYEKMNAESSSTGDADANAGFRLRGSAAVDITRRFGCGPDGPFT